MSNESRGPKRSLIEFVFRRQLPLETETSLFILVSALDIFMTWTLLYPRQGGFFESNPIARYFLDHWGKEGFVAFKFVMVSVVCIISQIVAMTRLELGRKILVFGTLVVSCVVIYSFLLLLKHQYGYLGR